MDSARLKARVFLFPCCGRPALVSAIQISNQIFAPLRNHDRNRTENLSTHNNLKAKHTQLQATSEDQSFEEFVSQTNQSHTLQARQFRQTTEFDNTAFIRRRRASEGVCLDSNQTELAGAAAAADADDEDGGLEAADEPPERQNKAVVSDESHRT